MLRPRIIPCLLLHKGGLYKTVGFGQAKYVGDPLNAVRIFNEKEVDELQGYLDAPNKTFRDYKSQEAIYMLGSKVMKFLGLEIGGKR